MAFNIEEIKVLLEQNQQKLDQLSRKVDKIKRRLLWSSFMDTLKFLIIVVPIIIGLWYFQPAIKSFIETGGQLLQRLQSLNSAELLQFDDTSVERLRQQLYPEVRP